MRVRHWLGGLFLGVLLAAVPAMGQQHGGVAVKAGAQTFKNPLGDGEERTRARLELEAFSPRLFDGHVEVTGAMGFVRLSESDETLTVVDTEDGSVSNLPVSARDINDVRLGARVFPLASLGERQRFEPYVTGGLGYYWARSVERGAGRELCCGEHELVEEKETVADGLFPYVGVGVNMFTSEHASLVLEARHDFERIDNGLDTGGTSFMVGLRIGF